MRIIICGYGKMGKLLYEKLKSDHELYIVDKNLGYLFSDIKEEADLIIDFSSKDGIYSIYDYLKNNKSSLIIGTTGYKDEEEKIIQEISEKHTVIMSSNFSRGINILYDLIDRLNKYNLDSANITLLEKHNKNKIDSPSGTSKTIMSKLNYPINVYSVRCGDIIGEHELEIVLENEVINIKHTAYSRDIFIDGVIELIDTISDLKPGLYSLERIRYGKKRNYWIN